jgi:hypothetical protein
MRWPELVPERFCRTPAQVTLYGEGLTEDGGPEVIFSGEVRCNYQDKGKTVLTAEEKLVQLSGCALLPGDAFPQAPVISGGTITVFGVKRRIWQGEKARNPDGTVNYTRLDVI